MVERMGSVAAGVISFFSGIGSLDLGFEKAGFRTWLSQEINGSFVDGYRHARIEMGSELPVRGFYHHPFQAILEGSWHSKAIEAAMGEAREETGLVGFIGGPPCPDFSVCGRGAGADGETGRLTQGYVDVVCRMQPDFFLMENVPGLCTGRNRRFFDSVRSQFGHAGYRIAHSVPNTIDYYVPQARERMIMVGFRSASFPGADLSALTAGYPWLTHGFEYAIQPLACLWPGHEEFGEDSDRPAPSGMPSILKELTVQWWFDRNQVTAHGNAGRVFTAKSLGRFMTVREGDTTRKSFKRLHRWRYSPTVAYGNNEVHLHPYKPRRISVAEAMSLQSLPRRFVLPGDMSLSEMFKSVGNAVPYLFAKAMANSLGDTLEIARLN